MTPVDATGLTRANQLLAETEKINRLTQNKVFKTPLDAVVTPVRSFSLSSPRPMRGKSRNSQDHFGFHTDLNRPKKMRTQIEPLTSDSITVAQPQPNVLVSIFVYF